MFSDAKIKKIKKYKSKPKIHIGGSKQSAQF